MMLEVNLLPFLIITKNSCICLIFLMLFCLLKKIKVFYLNLVVKNSNTFSKFMCTDKKKKRLSMMSIIMLVKLKDQQINKLVLIISRTATPYALFYNKLI